jgi:hypothetical protein
MDLSDGPQYELTPDHSRLGRCARDADSHQFPVCHASVRQSPGGRKRDQRRYQQSLTVLQLDLEMLVNFGGLQRTEAEYSALFAAAGFKLRNVIPLGDSAQFSIFEALPV